MASTINVNDMQVNEAAKYYASIGIITNPIYATTDNCNSPGKQPIPSGWQIIKKPYSNEAIDFKFKTDKNIGFLCGARSNLTVIDIDWLRKGIWDELFNGVDTNEFVKTAHTEEKYHILFKYCKELKAGQYKFLGFDILSDDALVKDGATYIAGDNCVCAPSLHKDGNRYQINGNIEDRPEVPVIVVNKLNKLIESYNHIKKDVLPKCRPWFRNLWKALFELKDDELYHQTNIFYGDMENRVRCLHFFAELKVNGAEDEHLLIICQLLFGDRYNPETSRKELMHVNDKPATSGTIKADPYFSRFYLEPISTEKIQLEPSSGIFEEITQEELNKIRADKYSPRIPNLHGILDDNHFINIYCDWVSSLTDAYYEFQVGTSFWILSSLTEGKVRLRVKQEVIKPNLWMFFLGRSTTSRKTTVINKAKDIYTCATDCELYNDDYSLEGYLKYLSKTPVCNLVRDEVAGLLAKNYKKYNEGIFDTECLIYDGQDFRKTLTKEEVVVKNPFVTHLYGTTLDSFTHIMQMMTVLGGYGFRFLYFAPDYSKSRKDIDLETDEDIEKWAEILSRVKKLKKFFDESDIIDFKADPKALKKYNRVVADLETAIDKIGDSMLNSALGRYQIYILKLAMLIEIGKPEPSDASILKCRIKA
jgi:hypothetical protein